MKVKMSYKTDKLIKLFPDVYAANEKESLLYKLLDTIGAEHMAADDKIKLLLKSHWVDYAVADALDALGATFNMSRRQLREGTPETDDAFRERLKSAVPFFTGGGTVEAILNTVRFALGLPYNLDILKEKFHGIYDDLIDEIKNLVTIQEFSPKKQTLTEEGVTEVDKASQLILDIDVPSVKEERPIIKWKFTKGMSRMLTIELMDTGQGIKSVKDLIVPEGKTLILSSLPDGSLSASIDFEDVSDQFIPLNGDRAILPQIPLTKSRWKFRAQSALFDISYFDQNETFDLPLYNVHLNWLTHQALSFDVHVPYFIQDMVQRLINDYKSEHLEYINHSINLSHFFIYEGLPLDQINSVVNETKAAGVQGNVHFTLYLPKHPEEEKLDQYESFNIDVTHKIPGGEDANARDALNIGSIGQKLESHDVTEGFAIGGVFDVSTFDGVYSFI